MPRQGLLIVNTGKGKGKTTAAMGLAFRALGHGLRVCIIQFIKGPWNYGEQRAAERFGELVEFHTKGSGFTWQSEDLEQDIRIAQEAWQFAKGTIAEDRHDIIILDELTYLVEYEMVDDAEVVETLTARPADMHIVVTGRGASRALIEAAEVVTDMTCVKHPYDSGQKAQRGIEY